MCEKYYECANIVSNILDKKCITYKCEPNKYAVTWFDGKKFTLITMDKYL